MAAGAGGGRIAASPAAPAVPSRESPPARRRDAPVSHMGFAGPAVAAAAVIHGLFVSGGWAAPAAPTVPAGAGKSEEIGGPLGPAAVGGLLDTTPSLC